MCNSGQAEKARATASGDVQPRRHEDTKTTITAEIAEHAETAQRRKATTKTRRHEENDDQRGNRGTRRDGSNDERQPRRHEDTKNDDQRGDPQSTRETIRRRNAATKTRRHEEERSTQRSRSTRRRSRMKRRCTQRLRKTMGGGGGGGGGEGAPAGLELSASFGFTLRRRMGLHVPPELEAKPTRAAENGREADEVALVLMANALEHEVGPVAWWRRRVPPRGGGGGGGGSVAKAASWTRAWSRSGIGHAWRLIRGRWTTNGGGARRDRGLAVTRLASRRALRKVGGPGAAHGSRKVLTVPGHE